MTQDAKQRSMEKREVIPWLSVGASDSSVLNATGYYAAADWLLFTTQSRNVMDRTISIKRGERPKGSEC